MIYVTSGGGGGGSGGTLVVNAPEDVTVTVTKDEKSYTRTANAQNKATFMGLESGTWNVTISDGNQTSDAVPVTVTTDYEVTIAFFSATIAVTYPAGDTCTCTKDGTTLTASGTGGSYTFTVPEAGEWEISCTNGEKTASKSVIITEHEQIESVTLAYSLELLYNGILNSEVCGSVLTVLKSTFTNGIISNNGTGGNNGAAYSGFENKLYLTDYSVLYYSVKLRSKDSQYPLAVGISSNKVSYSGYNDQKSKLIAFDAPTQISNDFVIRTIDISDVSEGYFIIIGASAEDVNAVWCE